MQNLYISALSSTECEARILGLGCVFRVHRSAEESYCSLTFERTGPLRWNGLARLGECTAYPSLGQDGPP